jgi:23S rRNA pseudouridine2605 synthase
MSYHSRSRKPIFKSSHLHGRKGISRASHSQNREQTPEVSERVQKVLARAGLGSRRQIETWIQEGRVKVNQNIVSLGDKVNTGDEIRINGRKLRQSDLYTPYRQQILCYHKPIGEVCTRYDDEGRTTIFERLPSPKHGRWISIGRLDLNTAGLLLLTTDGDLAHRLMHPSYEIEREYAVRILGEVERDMLERLREGVELDDGMARFKRIVDAGGTGANHWYHVTLMEGRKHEVRRLWESQGVTVSRLIRIRFGPVSLPKGLRLGHYVDLDSENQKALLEVVGLKRTEPFHQINNPFTPRRAKKRINSKARSHK